MSIAYIDMKSEREYTIGEAVQRLSRAGFDISEHSLRVYERKGLLKPIPRPSGRFRKYSEADIQGIISILKDLSLGFEMSEIQALSAKTKWLKETRQMIAAGKKLPESTKDLREELHGLRNYLRKYKKVAMAVKDREKFFSELQQDLEAAENISLRMRE